MSKGKRYCIILSEEDHKKLKAIADKNLRSISNQIAAWIQEESKEK